MKQRFHREITQKALGGIFEITALETVITANLGQDALRYQFGHAHFHYDANSFPAGDAYCEELRQAALAALRRSQGPSAREFFGRLTHTVQDLYAHSNYIALWRETQPAALPDDIEPEESALLRDPRLHSGKLYYPLEALTFIPALKPFVLPFLPHDSHAWMNIDDPSRLGFDYAYAAAVRRTTREFERLSRNLSPQEVVLLTGHEI